MDSWDTVNVSNSQFVSDAVACEEYDRVMPVFDDESVYVARRIEVTRRNIVLDVGTGCGLLAITAAHQARTVVGVDVNPRAVAYARKNATLNEVADRCLFLPGDLYAPVAGRTFDLIVCNPPFVPLPTGYRMFLSADGGRDGMDVVRRVIFGAPRHLPEGGRLLLLTLSLGSDARPLVFCYLRKAFAPRCARIVTTHIYDQVRIGAEPFFRLFEDVPSYPEWRGFLAQQQLTHLYYMLHEVEPHDRFEHLERHNKEPLEQTEFSGSWDGRLNRFRTWLERKRGARQREHHPPTV